MRRLLCLPAPCALLVTAALAQAPQTPTSPRPAHPQNQQFYYHYEWGHGAILSPSEWKRGVRLDYRRSHLDPPPPTYEWREIDRNYVLASTSTHAIVRVVAAPHPTIPGHSGGEP
ncbi:MAG TPA: RcnB family protein [Acidobacteriaceae bacterium]|jgi:Ni/Co efflux regulator RcnB|nr:RcnB family protein [Acidobacteriaceae bacterium]